MDAVCERGNLWLAYERVTRNKGSAGVDGIGVPEFKAHLQQHWPTIKAKLLAGTYIPQAVRRVDIPKPQGGVRTLGIPTLTDRLIQQALHQVLSPIFEAEFSESSYGFRPRENRDRPRFLLNSPSVDLVRSLFVQCPGARAFSLTVTRCM
jgi:RNA-directed DNA polymerase